jgi:HAT1-interacting factor 1
VGEDSPETADLYFSYGKALLENAITQSTVLGKEEPTEGKEDEGMLQEDFQSFQDTYNPLAPTNTEGKGPILSFSGDAEDDEAVDLFAQAAKDVAEAEGEEEEEGDEDGDGGEPEDDFNAAWEVLDLARAIYEKQKDEDEEIKLKLADTFIALGDVSLETGKCSTSR